jgi:hypothetical protein
MLKALIPVGASLIISVAAYLISRRKRDVGRWMKERRIDATEKSPMVMTCGVCGDGMSMRVKHTGDQAGVAFWVCNSFPECRKVERCE